LITFTSPVTELIRLRSSCRSYASSPLDAATRKSLADAIRRMPPGPFGSPGRFELAAASEKDRNALRGLGTYGFIRSAPAFIIGAAPEAGKFLEDFGFRMETLVLAATGLGLGTCWLGGTFTRGTFARKISAGESEILPAVCAVGVPAHGQSVQEQTLRKQIRADRRLGWERLFFNSAFSRPLLTGEAGEYAKALEMVRLGPSASNKQPWRVVKDDGSWHFYLQRTPGYIGGKMSRLMGVADMQRLDMGIAMCHFALTAAEMGLPGTWVEQEPPLEKPDAWTEYVATWLAAG